MRRAVFVGFLVVFLVTPSTQANARQSPSAHASGIDLHFAVDGQDKIIRPGDTIRLTLTGSDLDRVTKAILAVSNRTLDTDDQAPYVWERELSPSFSGIKTYELTVNYRSGGAVRTETLVITLLVKPDMDHLKRLYVNYRRPIELSVGERRSITPIGEFQNGRNHRIPVEELGGSYAVLPEPCGHKHLVRLKSGQFRADKPGQVTLVFSISNHTLKFPIRINSPDQRPVADVTCNDRTFTEEEIEQLAKQHGQTGSSNDTVTTRQSKGETDEGTDGGGTLLQKLKKLQKSARSEIGMKNEQSAIGPSTSSSGDDQTNNGSGTKRTVSDKATKDGRSNSPDAEQSRDDDPFATLANRARASAKSDAHIPRRAVMKTGQLTLKTTPGTIDHVSIEKSLHGFVDNSSGEGMGKAFGVRISGVSEGEEFELSLMHEAFADTDVQVFAFVRPEKPVKEYTAERIKAEQEDGAIKIRAKNNGRYDFAKSPVQSGDVYIRLALTHSAP